MLKNARSIADRQKENRHLGVLEASSHSVWKSTLASQSNSILLPTPRKEIFGGIITFVPCLRLKDFRVSRQESFEVLALQVGTAHGGEKLEVMFPSDNEKAILKAMEQMLLSRASAK